MKILYLITGLNIGGAEMILGGLIDGLNEERVKVTMLNIYPAGKIRKMMERME